MTPRLALVAILVVAAPVAAQSPDRPAVLLHVAQDPAGQGDYRAYRNTQAVMVTTRAVVVAALKKPGVGELRMVKAQDDAGAWLRENLEVDFPLDGEVMRVRLRGGNPKEAAVLVNAVGRSYLEQLVAKDPVARRLAELRELAARTEAGLKQSRQAAWKLAGLPNGLDGPTRASGLKFIEERLGQKNRELAVLQVRVGETESARQAPAKTPSEAAKVRRQVELVKTAENVLAAEISQLQRTGEWLKAEAGDLEALRAEIRRAEAARRQIGEQIAELEALRGLDRVTLLEAAEAPVGK